MRTAAIWLILLGLLTLRLPELFFEPRFWAEEGSIYFAHALRVGALDALASAHLGYYSLIPTLATTLAAHLGPLAQAPLITTLFAFAWQVATLAIILSSRSRLLPTQGHRAALAIALILTSPAEVWLNTINAQFWAATGVFIILFSDLPGRHKQAATLAYLAIACLTGVPSLFFAMYLPVRWILSRDRFWAWANAIAATGLIIQLAAFTGTESTGDIVRFPVGQLAQIDKSMIRTMFWIGSDLFRLPLILPRGIVIAALMSAWLAFVLLHRKEPTRLLFTLFPALAYTALATFASDSMTGGPRYGLPIAAMTFIILINLTKYLPRPAALAVFFLGVALQIPSFLNMGYVHNPAWPTWQDQIAARDPAAPWSVQATPPTINQRFRFIIPPDSGTP